MQKLSIISSIELVRNDIFTNHLHVDATVGERTDDFNILLPGLLSLLRSYELVIAFLGHSSFAISSIGSCLLKFFSLKSTISNLSIAVRYWYPYILLTSSNSKTTLAKVVAVTIFQCPLFSVITIVGVETKAAFLFM